MGIDGLWYLLTGAAAGFSAGLLGVGGGLIIVPVLYSLFTEGELAHHAMHLALATSLASIVFTSLSSTRAHHRKGAVRWRLVAALSPGIVLGAILGSHYAVALDQAILRPAFALFEMLVAVSLALNTQTRPQATINPASAFITGNGIGFISSMTGIGGGTLTVPALHWFRVDIKQAIATSAACGFPVALSASLVYAGQDIPAFTMGEDFLLGYIHLPALGLIVVSSTLTAPLGARTAHALPAARLRQLFAICLSLLALRMLLAGQ